MEGAENGDPDSSGALHDGNVEIGEYHPAAALKQYVGGFDVSVENPQLMRPVQRRQQNVLRVGPRLAAVVSPLWQ